MRIAVIGAGSIGRRHHGNLRELGAEAVLVPWRDYAPERLDGCDGVVVATASDVRLGPVSDAAARRLPVFVEKPLAPSIAELERVTQAAAPVAERSMLGLMMRYHPAFRALARAELGDVFRFSFEIGHDVTQWRPGWVFSESYAARADGGGVLLDLCHELDMAACLFPGVRVARVESLGHQNYPGVDVASRVTLEGPRGALGEVSMDYLTPKLHRRATLHGVARMHDFDFAAQRYVVSDPEDARDLDLPLERNAMFLDIMRDFLCLVAGRPVSDVEHLPRLDRVGESVALVAQAHDRRVFVGEVEKELP
ncbi:Gfo/Idh/MocA family protein [Tranquillimonas alkanivorans]|uniref:Predicted dehydrogenase n=1 Tax=Tranquillimonas alkanivorans TaxID=441119 RepID=A0A1I5L7B1_9RHOB|nr:Gfo/Idh/MocA family oxidoreductase [Tranquillimonas alkanivorans]SFO93063.1 Predicted dehydrogenase [Tranquillimonas alkanivorans]